MKYAVVKIAGKQYLVEEGGLVKVDHLFDNAAGDKIVLTEVLLLVNDGKVSLGYPFCDTEVEFKLAEHKKDKKVTGMKYQSGRYRRKFGHRQKVTLLEVVSIGKKPPKVAHKKVEKE